MLTPLSLLSPGQPRPEPATAAETAAAATAVEPTPLLASLSMGEEEKNEGLEIDNGDMLEQVPK